MSDQTLEQRRDALDRANDIRSKRAAIKRKLGEMSREDGRDWVADLIWNTPGELASMTASSLLLAIRGIGDTRVSRWLVHAFVGAGTTVGALTARQRKALVESLSGESPGGEPAHNGHRQRPGGVTFSTRVPPEIERVLRSRAEANGRSVAREIRAVLSEALLGEAA